jgi:hypothetical protein
VGRAGLEPATLCLKDSGEVVNRVYVFQSVHFLGSFHP